MLTAEQILQLIGKQQADNFDLALQNKLLAEEIIRLQTELEAAKQIACQSAKIRG